MPDLVVTVPRHRWAEWIGEGSLPGHPGTVGELFAFGVGKGPKPPIAPGDRVYVAAWDRLRGYAPLIKLSNSVEGWALVRAGGAVACTIREPIRGFAGFRERWWRREDERGFAGWATEGVPLDARAVLPSGSPALPTEEGDEELDDVPPEEPAAPEVAAGWGASGAKPPRPRELTPQERKHLAQGVVHCKDGKILKINPAPWHGFAADRCPLCVGTAAAGRPAVAHAHRLPLTCHFCQAAKVYPRGPRGQRAPEVFCVACGNWWTPDDLTSRGAEA